MPKKATPTEHSFEELYTELEATIEQLESGNLPLDDALALYERGIALAKECTAMLDVAELRIQELAPGAVVEDADDLIDEAEVEDEPF